jgi:hypothetical protein
MKMALMMVQMVSTVTAPMAAAWTSPVATAL